MSMTVLAPIPIWFVCKLCRGLFHEIDKFVKHEKDIHSVDFASVKCIVFEVTAAVINHNQDIPPEFSKILNEQEEGSPSLSSRSYLERLDKLSQDIFSQRIQYEDENLSDSGQGQHHMLSTAIIASEEEIQDKTLQKIDPSTDDKVVNLNYGPLFEVVETKTENVADGNGNEDCEFPDEDLDPLESESNSPMKSLAEEETLNYVADSSSTNLNEPTQVPQTSLYSFYCVPCKKSFSRMQQIKEHNKRNHHETRQDSSKNLEQCPHPNCEITTSSKLDLTRHLLRAHSNTKPHLKCPHPNCTLSFKTQVSRTRHLKLHATKQVKEKL